MAAARLVVELMANATATGGAGVTKTAATNMTPTDTATVAGPMAADDDELDPPTVVLVILGVLCLLVIVMGVSSSSATKNSRATFTSYQGEPLNTDELQPVAS